MSALTERFSEAPTTDAGYLLAAVVAAAASKSEEVKVDSGSNEVSIDYSYYDYSAETAEAILSQKPSGLDKAAYRLVAAIRAGLVAGAPRVDFESWDGSNGVRFKVTPEAVKTESLTKAPWKDGNSRCRITVRFRTGLSRKIFSVGSR